MEKADLGKKLVAPPQASFSEMTSHIKIQSNLDISNSDISNSAKLEASI